MTAYLEQEIIAVEATGCGKCGTILVHKKDAIGRVYTRCPKCDGVAPEQHRHPDDAMLPQGLVKVHTLPPVQPGQLRCQQCARGVEGDVRFCVTCQARRDEAARPTTTCRHCGRTRLRERKEWEFTKRCEVCIADELRIRRANPRPRAPRLRTPPPPKPTTRPCPGCGAPIPIKRGKPPARCEACP